MTTNNPTPTSRWLSYVLALALIAIAAVSFALQQRQPESPSATAQIEAPAVEEPANYDRAIFETLEEAERECPGDVTTIAGPVSSPPRYGCVPNDLESRRFGGS